MEINFSKKVLNSVNELYDVLVNRLSYYESYTFQVERHHVLVRTERFYTESLLKDCFEIKEEYNIFFIIDKGVLIFDLVH